jgi:catechol 2,3-dioxygenase-like lactoylglutathione lyase family enzyme
VDITIIDHVGLNITDLNRSAEWYSRILGFEIIHKWTTTWMVGKGQMRIGLFQRPSATPVEDLDNRIAISHLAFLTDADGFKRTQEKLTQLGVPFDPPDDSGIALSIFFRDPDGHELEVTTYHDDTDA